jgi:hypothetical protein
MATRNGQRILVKKLTLCFDKILLIQLNLLALQLYNLKERKEKKNSSNINFIKKIILKL